MKTQKSFLFALVFTFILSISQIQPAHAGAGDCFYTPPDTITCTTGGSGENGDPGGDGDGGSGEGESEPCIEVSPVEFFDVLLPASFFEFHGDSPPPDSCLPARGNVDICTGNILFAYITGLPTECPT